MYVRAATLSSMKTKQPRKMATATADQEGLRQRRVSYDESATQEPSRIQNWTDESDPEDDPTLPFNGKVYLARKKKPDSTLTKIIEVCAVLFVAGFIYYSYHYMDDLHFKVTHFYARLGQPHSMHMVGQRYLFGKGVQKDTDVAMEWFGYAAEKGHPHASHNLAVGHLHGYKTNVRDKGHVKELLQYAVEKGVPEANNALNRFCSKGDC